MARIKHRCAVLGKPIAHSLSPVLHDAAYRTLGLDDWTYERQEIAQEDLAGFLNGLDRTWRGLSLTMPLKKTIQAYGTPKDAWTATLGVSNTAVFRWPEPAKAGERPEIDLYNTDVPGILYAFQHAYSTAGRKLEDCNVEHAVVIGNGNTAASAVSALSVLCAACEGTGDIAVVARHPGKNPDLARIVSDDDSCEIHEIDFSRAVESLGNADIAVSTIPGHAADAIAKDIIRDESFQPKGMLLDVVYDPRPSALIQAWREKGGLALGGEEMLLYQAVLQVILMTGEEGRAALEGRDPMETLEPAMRQALEEAL